MDFSSSPDSYDLDQPTPDGLAEDPGFGEGSGFEPGEPCQLCGATPARVNAYMWITSFVLLTRHAEYEALLCRGCSTKQALKEQAKSGLLGWWGFPWGLMTFKALWINARTLMRWSNLPAVAGVLTLILALAVPGSLVWMGLQGAEEDRVAKARGDWADEAVVERIEEGHRLYDEGDLDGALAAYLAAYESVPRSHALNFTLADLHLARGDLEAARPYIARAEEILPGDAGTVAFHGWLLFEAGDEPAAAERVERLRDLQPADPGAAMWMADFLEVMGEYDEQLRAVDAGLALAPGNPDLEARRVSSLVELDRLAEAEEALAALPAETAESPMGWLARATYRMRTEPLAAVDDLLVDGRSFAPSTVAVWLAVAEQAGALAEVRQSVADHLFAADTPGDAWASARPWFADDEWPLLLERYLANRTEAVPGFLRLQLYDPMAERAELLALADRVQRLDHPVARYADAMYFGLGPPGAHSHAERAAALERHLADAPEHDLCRTLLAAVLTRLEPNRAEAVLKELERRAADDPALQALVAVQRAELTLVRGPLVLALQQIRAIDPAAAEPYVAAAQVDLQAAETAFHAGNDAVFEERLGRLLTSGDASAHAAALVLRWSRQLASGETVTYGRDVDRYLDLYAETAQGETSASVQGILVAEGLVDRAAVEKLIAREQHATLDLVRLLRDAAVGQGEPGDLDRLAALESHQYAPLIARKIVDRRVDL